MAFSQSDLYWVLFIAGGFGAAELILWRMNGQKGTLTAFLRKVLGIEPARKYRPFGIFVVGVFSVWVFVHLVFGL